MEDWHGTPNGYGNKKCRCDDCRDAWNEYHREFRRRPQPEGMIHGIASSYTNRGCKCPECKAAKTDQYRRQVYGLPEGTYQRLYDEQEGLCTLCRKWQKMLHVDHDHQTGRVRGLLCVGCNGAIGKLGDNIEGLLRAIDYLKNAESLVI